MDVKVFYTAEYAPAPGGVQTYTSPLDASAEEWVVSFGQADGADEYSLALRKLVYIKDDKRWEWRVKRRLLRCRCGSMAEYDEWLRANVSHVLVDGSLFWVNPGGEKGEEGGEE